MKMRGLVPVQGYYSLDVKAFLGEQEQSSEPGVGELPKTSPSLGYRDAKETKGSDTAFFTRLLVSAP